MVQEKNDMREEYDFSKGVRGKHYRQMQAGYTITIHQPDGTTIQEVMPDERAVFLDPEVREYFPDSESVNKALRCLMPLMSKRRGQSKK